MKLELTQGETFLTYASGEDARDRPTEGVRTLTSKEMDALAGDLLADGYELFTDPALGGGQVFLLEGAVRMALVHEKGQFLHVQEARNSAADSPPVPGAPPEAVRFHGVPLTPDEGPKTEPAPEVLTGFPDVHEEPGAPQDVSAPAGGAPDLTAPEPTDPNEGKGDETPTPTPEPPKEAEGA